MFPPEEHTTFGGICKDASYFLKKEKKILKIALIAHDKKKDEIIELAKQYKDVLANYELYATGTTGTLIMGETALPIHRMKKRTSRRRPTDRCNACKRRAWDDYLPTRSSDRTAS